MGELFADIQINVVGNTVVLDLSGMVGINEVNAIKAKLEVEALPRLNPPWALVASTKHWGLYTPEVKENLDSIAQWYIENGLGFSVMLTEDESLLKQKAISELVKGRDEIEHVYLGSMEAAQVWLRGRDLWPKE